MTPTTFCLVLLVAVFADAKDAELKEYVIDLDSPAKEHWKEVALDYKESIYQVLIEGFMAQLDPTVSSMLSIMASGMLGEIPQPYRDELIGLAEYTNITMGEAIVFTMLYELTAHGSNAGTGHAACTSIVATLPNGHVIHGRNLDYGIAKLNQIAINVDFQRNGKTVYKGTTFAGYIGILTGYKPEGFTISMDERDQGSWMLNDNQSAKLGPNGIAAFKIRDLFADDSSDFKTAVKTLASTELIAPCYIIVGGVKGNEGAVITHGRTGAVDVWRLNDTADQWFLVETNYDHWVAPPTSDDRRDPAIKLLSSMGQGNLTSDSLYTVLSTSPILNSGTVYTTLMSAGDGLYNAWARNL